MRSFEDVDQAIIKAAHHFQEWDIKDQMRYMAALTVFGELCDEINRKYDGRNQRMIAFLEKLKK